jgi:hypothetical protein
MNEARAWIIATIMLCVIGIWAGVREYYIIWKLRKEVRELEADMEKTSGCPGEL